MTPVFRSCVLCSLRTACFLIVGYTFFLAILLLSFNAHDFYYANHYIIWSRIVSFVFAILLFVAAICLLSGLRRNSRQMHSVWLSVFASYILFQICSVAWNIYYYTDAYYPMPVNIRQSTLSNIVVFGLLIFLNIVCLLTVHSHQASVLGV